MFKEVQDGKGSNVFAFVEDADIKQKFFDYRNMVEYCVPAFWFVDRGATKGSLAYGHVVFTFYNEFAQEFDDLNDYFNLDLDTILELAGKEIGDARVKLHNGDVFYSPQTKVKDVKPVPDVIFGNGKAWTYGGDGEKLDLAFRTLVDSWFNLPNMPTGTSKWLKCSKR